MLERVAMLLTLIMLVACCQPLLRERLQLQLSGVDPVVICFAG